MWIGLITTIAVGSVCALYVWQAYAKISEDAEEAPQSPRPMENSGWDSLLGLKTSEFDRME
ncbi:MAG: hypothetical protein ABEN55_07490 [Bradymonadaceae bacterium]